MYGGYPHRYLSNHKAHATVHGAAQGVTLSTGVCKCVGEKGREKKMHLCGVWVFGCVCACVELMEEVERLFACTAVC